MHYKHKFYPLESTTYCIPRNTLYRSILGTTEAITPSFHMAYTKLPVSCTDVCLIHKPGGKEVYAKAFGVTSLMTTIQCEHEQLHPVVQRRFINRDIDRYEDSQRASMISKQLQTRIVPITSQSRGRSDRQGGQSGDNNI